MFKKGFTLIELVMVIVILAILAAVAVPQYVNLTGTAKANATKATLGSIRAAIAVQYAKNAVAGAATYPTLAELSGGTLFVGGEAPKETYTSNQTKAKEMTASAENPIATFVDDGGWIYNATTGEIRVDIANTNVDSNGLGAHSW